MVFVTVEVVEYNKKKQSKYSAELQIEDVLRTVTDPENSRGRRVFSK